MKRSGQADLPLHYGKVPPWLYDRMTRLGGAIIEAILVEYGQAEVLKRLSDPFWFQSLGAVLGMDWHSSGITTSVMGALKKAINPRSAELGIYICGGRGKHSRQTPQELMKIADQTGLDGNQLVKASKLSAKVDNTAIQDGFQLYLHSFILSSKGDWAVIQQGMNQNSRMARRYHWHSPRVKSFVEDPHAFVCGENQGLILNLVDQQAGPARQGIQDITRENPDKMMREVRKILMPRHHEVRASDVNIKRLGSVLALAQESSNHDFAKILLINGLGPRTLQSLTLVSEVIYGTPSRFSDPARFSFAHGGKDGHPFPVPTKTYDESIRVLKNCIEKSRIGNSEKQEALKKLHLTAQQIEQNFIPNTNFKKAIEQEKRNSWKYGGRTVFGKEKPPANQSGKQLNLFD